MITESQHACSVQAYNIMLYCMFIKLSQATLTFSSIWPAKQILSGQVARPSEQETVKLAWTIEGGSNHEDTTGYIK